MKLRNKKTGEILDDVQYRNYSLSDGFGFRMNDKKWEYHSLAELVEEWEDVPEPTTYYYVSGFGAIREGSVGLFVEDEADMKKIDNYFSSREEAEKALDKLKAFKRLKDKGFRLDGYDVAHKGNGDLAGQIFYDAGNYSIDNVEKEMDLLFGGEE